jgi:PiT family inorganic phosphate transporter
MDFQVLFITSGLFLGWSLGANDAANIFGAAVSSKIIRFRTAAFLMSVFIIIGAVVSGSGASHTLGKLGAISQMSGAFIVALSAAIVVTLMTKKGLPVSTSQAIVGGIVGWNFFSKQPTQIDVLLKILSTWFLCPFLAAIFALILHKSFIFITRKIKMNLFRRYYYIRLGLLMAGSFGAYSLGANNIGNVMGVFTNAFEFTPIKISVFTLNSTQILFLLGGIAIAFGVITYSKGVMNTVGSQILKISPPMALIVVLASSLVLFLFASQSLKLFLESHNLPSLPLVPVSSSQAIVGSVIGIGLSKGANNINYKKLQKIAMGWVLTPLAALIISYISLFFMQNVFQQIVY